MIEKYSMEDFHALASQVSLAEVLPNYTPVPGRFDEMMQLDHDAFVAWLHLLTDTQTLAQVQTDPQQIYNLAGPITDRWRRVKHWLQEHGTSRSSHAALPANKSWELDPIPMLILQKHWEPLSNAISQRAKLIDHITRDIYGPQRLLADGSIPVELVYGSPAYIPSMQATIRAGEPAIYLYGVQLCRDYHGNWLAIADRTQGPSGCGYAVENRITLSRVLAEEFRDFHVQRSAGFFATLRDTIAAYANLRIPAATTVLLSPGVRSETYFEDAYLARYLGYSLAQVEDLTVRGGEVFQKTLSGLVRVQSILRRTQDNQCDPLEFAAATGIPGLCQAVRDGTVSIANPIGCGWAEMPAIASLLPELCKRVLGEELLLPTVPMHWCGKEESLKFTLEHLDVLEIRNALARNELSTISFPQKRTAAQRAELIQKIKATPWKYMGVESTLFSTAPVWHNDQIQPWPMVMRGFATLCEDRYMTLPGGIARLGPSGLELGESLGTGELSKDVWVLGDKPPIPLTLRQPVQKSIELRRGFELPSRVAENLYWLGRNTQRAECTIRHARTVANRLIEDTDLHLARSYAAIFDAMDPSTEKSWPIQTDSSESIMRSTRRKLHASLFNKDLPNSLSNVLWSTEYNMVMVRDRLSVDNYQLLSSIVAFRGQRKLVDPANLGDAVYELSNLLTSFSAFSGMVAENMTRGPGWVFMDLGVRIERLLHQLNVIRSYMVHDYAWLNPMMEAALEIMDSTMTYRFRYLMSVEIDPTIDLLLLDESNPRAVAFQISQLDDLLATILSTPQISAAGLPEQKKQITESRAAIRLIDTETLSALSNTSDDITLPMVPPSFTTHAEPTVASSNKKLTILDVFPTLLASDRKRYALQILTERIEYCVNELHSYLSNRFFAHTATVQRIGDGR